MGCIDILTAYHNTASAKDYTSDECATTYKRETIRFQNFIQKHTKKMIIYLLNLRHRELLLGTQLVVSSNWTTMQYHKAYEELWCI